MFFQAFIYLPMFNTLEKTNQTKTLCVFSVDQKRQENQNRTKELLCVNKFPESFTIKQFVNETSGVLR